MAQLSKFELTLLKELYKAPVSKKNPQGVFEILSKKDERVTLRLVRAAFTRLLDEGYIYQKYDTTPLADREIGMER
jgi:hypothetical protein